MRQRRSRLLRIAIWSVASITLILLSCGVLGIIASQTQRNTWFGTNEFQVEIGPSSGPTCPGERQRYR